MTLIQYANMRWNEMHKSSGVTMRECKELYPLESFVQEWMNSIRDRARNGTLTLNDSGMKDLEKRGYTRIRLAIIHDYPYLQDGLSAYIMKKGN